MKLTFRPTSLVFKIVLFTSLILVFAISFNVWWNTILHEASIEKLTQEKTKIIAEYIEQNVIRAMVRGRHFDMHRILGNFSAYQDIRKINLFTLDGIIIASSVYDELQRNVGNVEFFLKNPTFIREDFVQDKTGKKQKERVYYFNRPISNRPECYQCHDPNHAVIGILSVSNSLREMDHMISRIKIHSVILAVITLGFLSLVSGLLYFRFIELPIRKLILVMGNVEQGDLSARVDFRSRDEMGRLGKSLNTMIEKLDLAKQEAETYHKELVQRADRMASIGELASGIAHEIRNPLAGIQGAIQIIAEGFPREDSRRQITEEIQKQIYRLERLVKGLLNYTKPAPSYYLPSDVNDLLDRVLTFLATQQGELEDFKIEKSFSAPLPKIRIDPDSMEQAFLNIILNAQKAMPNGGTLRVSTRPLNRDEGLEEVQIIFEDTGVGIPRENLLKIFNPFFSTRAEGTGLGLSITKNIVEQHEGKIEVESQVHRGTRFTITLPAIK
jgi:two-component system NtrC family sensor kinase